MGKARQVLFTKSFDKDLTRLQRSGRYDITALRAVIEHLIRNEAPLAASHRDHKLIGDWAGFRECHIGGDYLLIYRIDATAEGERISFVRAGSHADLFKD